MLAQAMNSSFKVESGGFELLPRVEALWYELKEHHQGMDPRFPDMSTPDFQLRKAGLKDRAKELLVDLVLRKSDGREAGYCFSTVDANGIGEIESLYVREEFRRQGIGRELAMRALSWMDQKHATAKRVSVLSGNKEAIGFYEHFGFQTRVQELMIPTNKGASR